MRQLLRDAAFAAAASVGLLTVVMWAGIPPSIALAFAAGLAAGVGLILAAGFVMRRGDQ